MLEKNVSDLKFPKMSLPQHMDRTLRLIWIQGINTDVGKNSYRVLFRDIYTGMYLIENIFPEFLSIFTVGSHYRDSEKVEDLKPLGVQIDIRIVSTEDNQIRRIADVITDEEYDLRHAFPGKKGLVDYSEANKRQPCVVFENQQQSVIIPCSLIGAVFYSTSTSMRKQIFAQNLEGLYEKVGIDRELKIASIRLKPGALDGDKERIVRFAVDEFANAKWIAIRYELNRIKSLLLSRGEPYYSVPLKIDIPVKQVLNMKVRGLRFNSQGNSKEKILVLEIHKEDSTFPFDTLIQENVEKKTLVENKESQEILPAFAYKTSDRIRDESPSSYLKSLVIRSEAEEKNTNIGDIKVNRRCISEEVNEIHPEREGEGAERDLSVMTPESSGDKSIRPGELNRKPKKKSEEKPREVKKDSSFEDFKRLIGILESMEGVSDLKLSGPWPMPKKHEGRSHTLRETYDRTNPRQYLFATFMFNQQNGAVVEIDQRNLPNGSSIYILTSNLRGISESDVDGMLKLYVKQKKMEEITIELKKDGIVFMYKNHPLAKKDEGYYKSWCEDLLKKIGATYSVSALKQKLTS